MQQAESIFPQPDSPIKTKDFAATDRQRNAYECANNDRPSLNDLVRFSTWSKPCRVNSWRYPPETGGPVIRTDVSSLYPTHQVAL
jgi:hypothetical protein